MKKNKDLITPEQIERIAHLSRLELLEGDRERFTKQLKDILEYVNLLQNLDTEDIDPTFLIAPLSNVLRKNTERQSMTAGAALSIAPSREDDYFKMPRILPIEDS